MRPELLLGLLVADGLWRELGVRGGVTVTALLNGQHKEGSLHYQGLAADLRVHDLPVGPSVATTELAARLGTEWDVVLEAAGTDNAHCHMEYDPS